MLTMKSAKSCIFVRYVRQQQQLVAAPETKETKTLTAVTVAVSTR